MISVEINYEINEKEMLVIVEVCKTWKHYLKKIKYSIRAIIDYFNLWIFLIIKILSRREARWWEKLFNLYLQIEYKLKKKNLVDDFSRRLDYVNAELISLRRDEITLSNLKIIEKNREIKIRSWTIIEKKSLKSLSSYNHDFQDETREIFSSIVVKMNVVSNVARVSISEIQAMMRKSKKRKNKKVALSKTDEITIDFKSMKFRLIEFNRNAECQRVIDATEKEIVFAFFFLKLRIVLRILQETNHLAMRRRSRVASLSSWNLR
jgi:hypothetical protein